MRYDHFHATWQRGNEQGEIEGGLSPAWSEEDFRAVWNLPEQLRNRIFRSLAVDWGMPTDGTVVSFRVAG